MSKSKLDLIPNSLLKQIVMSSSYFYEVLEQIGYKQCSDKRTIKRIVERCQQLNIDCSHLEQKEKEKDVRIFPEFIICTQCGHRLPNTEFYQSCNKIRHVCKECVRQNQRDKYRKRVQEIIDYKSSIGCKKCGDKRGYVLDFHHKDPSEKDYAISDEVHLTLNQVKQEISKCDVLCSNCHREWHYLYPNGIIEDYNKWMEQ